MNPSKLSDPFDDSDLSKQEIKELLMYGHNLIDAWFAGWAMVNKYKIAAFTIENRGNGLTEENNYDALIDLYTTLANYYKIPSKQLFRVFPSNEDLEVGKGAKLKPGKNILSSWTDSKSSAENFMTSVLRYHKIPQKYFYVISIHMPEENLLVDYKTVIKYLDFLGNNYRALNEKYDLDMSEGQIKMTLSQIESINRYIMHIYSKQKEYICYTPNPVEVKVVSRFLVKSMKRF